MALEMLSGPDLGAGYLYQLSLDREPPPGRFTYHAQVGGLDAGDAPAGPLEVLGWTQAPGMCMLGGRACWHREFELPVSEALRVRTPYNRTRFVMAALLDQRYRAANVPWSEGLTEFLGRVADALGPSGSWYLVGDVALRLQGIDAPVRWVELRTRPEAVGAIAAKLPEYGIEPAAVTRWEPGPMMAARAFVGTMGVGVRIGWAAPLGTSPESPLTGWTLSEHGIAPKTVRWEGRELPVVPLEVGVLDAARSGAPGSFEAARSALRADRVDRGLLGRVLRSPAWPADLGERLARELGASGRSPVEE